MTTTSVAARRCRRTVLPTAAIAGVVVVAVVAVVVVARRPLSMCSSAVLHWHPNRRRVHLVASCRARLFAGRKRGHHLAVALFFLRYCSSKSSRLVFLGRFQSTDYSNNNNNNNNTSYNVCDDLLLLLPLFLSVFGSVSSPPHAYCCRASSCNNFFTGNKYTCWCVRVHR